jgi:AcrR family transcriptional regulator
MLILVRFVLKDTVQKILDAANAVIHEKGFSGFTIEEVAREAGISKGGLLHYFKSKDELVKGMVLNFDEKINAAVKQRVSSVSDPSVSDHFCATVIEGFNMVRAYPELNSGLVAAVALNKELLKPMKKNVEEDVKNAEASKDPVFSMLALLASIGLTFLEIMEVDVISEELKDKMLVRILETLEERKGKWS